MTTAGGADWEEGSPPRRSTYWLGSSEDAEHRLEQ